MPDNFQGINSGQGELKDFYEDDSQYEAIRRRRKRAAEKEGIILEDKIAFDTVPKPNPKYKNQGGF